MASIITGFGKYLFVKLYNKYHNLFNIGNEPIDIKSKKAILILGNGFDRDIGINITYSDFVRSNSWPKEPCASKLLGYLKQKGTTDKWFNMEDAMLEYTKLDNQVATDVKMDQEALSNIKANLFWYALKQSTSKCGDIGFVFNEESFGSYVLDLICEGKFDIIYSFNYTNFKIYFVDKRKDLKVEYMHGRLEDGYENSEKLVLGTVDNGNSNMTFLSKTLQLSGKSPNIKDDLIRAQLVVFFGHSLGVNDSQYFKEFFIKIGTGELKPKYPVTIITLNQNSKAEILQNVAAMTGMSYDMFSDKLQFIFTEEGYVGRPILLQPLCYLYES